MFQQERSDHGYHGRSLWGTVPDFPRNMGSAGYSARSRSLSNALAARATVSQFLFFFFFLESALFTAISLLYVLTTITKCQIAGDLPSALLYLTR